MLTPIEHPSSIEPLISRILALLAALACFALPSSADGRFIYSDLDRFQSAYREYLETGDVTSFEPYLAKGSIGLQEFRSQFAVTAETLAESVDLYPKFYASLKGLRRTMQNQEAGVLQAYDKLRAILPDAPLPAVYFLVGGLRGGGQGGEGNYVLVAAEIFSVDEDSDVSEFSDDERMFPPEAVASIVSHEAAHIVQEDLQGTERYLSIYQQGKGTLLAYALREGVAELVAKLASGAHINPRAEAYGLQHESELWEIFREERSDTDLGDWFFYRPKAHPEWPRDLGYWMGFRISQAYYDSRGDKTVALRELLRAADEEALLEASRYDGGVP